MKRTLEGVVRDATQSVEEDGLSPRLRIVAFHLVGTKRILSSPYPPCDAPHPGADSMSCGCSGWIRLVKVAYAWAIGGGLEARLSGLGSQRSLRSIAAVV